MCDWWLRLHGKAKKIGFTVCCHCPHGIWRIYQNFYYSVISYHFLLFFIMHHMPNKLYEISTIFLCRRYVEPTVNFANFFQEVKSGTFFNYILWNCLLYFIFHAYSHIRQDRTTAYSVMYVINCTNVFWVLHFYF